MNIFYLDRDPREAARMQCDKHVVKMIVESAQMLSTAHRVLDNRGDDILYKSTHVNHPSTVWVRSHHANYMWLLQHFYALCKEYTHRYGKIHLTETKLSDILWDMPLNIPIGESDIPLCMPEEFQTDCPVESYRNFYQSKQDQFKMKWTEREVPGWFNVN